MAQSTPLIAKKDMLYYSLSNIFLLEGCEESLKYLKNILKALSNFFLHYIDYILFLFLITFKLFLFARLTGTVFVKQGTVQYLSTFFDWLLHWNGDSLDLLRKGIVMISLGAILLLSFWILFLPRRARFLSLVILNFLITFMIFADLIYFRYFEDLISANVLLQIGQVGALGNSISNLFSGIDWIFFIDILVLIPITIFVFKKVKRTKASKQKRISRAASAVVVFAVGYLLVAYPMKVFIEKGGGYLFEKTLSNMRVYEVTGLLGFHGFDLYKFVNENVFHKNTISEKEKNHIQEWFKDHQKKISKKTPYYGIAKGKNVITVQVEAFQNFFIDKKVNGQEITPNLNKLKKESMYFNHFYHQTASGRTSDAEFLNNTSLYPLYTGSAYINYSGNTFTALPETLKDNGYETAAFHAYKPSFWNRYLMYKTIGIDTFYSLDTFKQDEKLGWSISDESMLRQSAEKMVKLKSPFYSFLITLSSHHPYDLPSNYQELDLNGYQDGTFKNYLQSVHYVDKAIGTFIEQLKKDGLWDESIVIFYGDHDSGLMKADSEIAQFGGAKGEDLTFNQMKGEVPMFIHLPGNAEAGVYQQVGGQIDISPTIMHLLGISPKGKYMMGTPLFQEDNRLVVFRTGAYTTNHVYYQPSLDGKFENGTCFDTKTKNKTTLEACKKDYEEATDQLEISDAILKGNLIKLFKRDGE